jgi:hypothetical protein
VRIYVASSWQNEHQPGVVELLTNAGHQVYDFRNPATGWNGQTGSGFQWEPIDPEWRSWTPKQFVEGLLDRRARDGFRNDMLALETAEMTILVLPSGNSAHLEAGFAARAGQRTAVYYPDGEPFVPELMYSMLGYHAAYGEDDLIGWVRTTARQHNNAIENRQYDRSKLS